MTLPSSRCACAACRFSKCAGFLWVFHVWKVTQFIRYAQRTVACNLVSLHLRDVKTPQTLRRSKMSVNAGGITKDCLTHVSIVILSFRPHIEWLIASIIYEKLTNWREKCTPAGKVRRLIQSFLRNAHLWISQNPSHKGRAFIYIYVIKSRPI